MSAPDFEGGVFATGIEGGRAGARVRVDYDATTATTSDGSVVSVPHGQCVVSVGGASGRMLFFKDRAGDRTIFSEDPALLRHVRAQPPRLLSDELARALGENDLQVRRSRTHWALALAALGVATLGAVYGVRGLGRRAVHALPLSVDTQLGELAASSMDMGGPASTDPVLVEAVQLIEKRLTPHAHAKLPFKLRVVQSDTVNAFALPGGTIVVLTGLLREAGSAEEVAGVLAHEMAHVTRRHGMERIAQSLGVVTAFQLMLGDVSGLVALGAELFQAGTINSYGREQEHEADMDGVDTLLAAGIDPEALAQFFQRLLSTHGDLPSVLAWLGTHPELEQRVKDVRARVKATKHGPFTPLALDFANVRRHAGAVLDAPVVPDP
jgi:predicted Zn-dependent protease